MATLEIPSNVKCITSGQVPTTTNLKDGEFAFGKVGGVAKLYGNVNGVIIDFTRDSADIPYSSSTPFMDGVGSVGSANTVARGDHRHPSDTSRQEKLVSGTNIKTINGQSVLGSGDIPISGGSEYANTSEIVDNAITLTSTSTLADLATQILAQKTKVCRVSYPNSSFSQVSRILPGAIRFQYGPPEPSLYAYQFKVISTDIIYCASVYDGAYYSHCLIARNSTPTYGESGWATTGWSSPSSTYRVGEIYITTTTSSPGEIFGGTWEQIKDVFLLAAGDTYTAGSTGGSANAVVVSHNHRLEKYGSVLAIYVPASESETSAGFVAAPTDEGLWGGVDKAATEINSTGESGTGKNMPPYLAVYMWKRVA